MVRQDKHGLEGIQFHPQMVFSNMQVVCCYPKKPIISHCYYALNKNEYCNLRTTVFNQVKDLSPIKKTITDESEPILDMQHLAHPETDLRGKLMEMFAYRQSGSPYQRILQKAMREGPGT